MEHGVPSQGLYVIRGDLEAITQANQRDSPFLRLPAELRNRIYEAGCLESTISVRPQSVINKSSPHSAKHRSSLSLVHVCRQIRHEAMSAFLHRTRFDLRNLYRSYRKEMDWSLCKVARLILIGGCEAAKICRDDEEQNADMLASHDMDLPCIEHVTVRLCCSAFRALDVQNGFHEVARRAFGCKTPQVLILYANGSEYCSE